MCSFGRQFVRVLKRQRTAVADVEQWQKEKESESYDSLC